MAKTKEPPALAEAEPRPPGGGDFGFGLEESVALTKALWEVQAPNLSHFGRVADMWRQIKGALIEALDPATGRRVVPLELTVTSCVMVQDFLRLCREAKLKGLQYLTVTISGEEIVVGAINFVRDSNYSEFRPLKKGLKLTRAMAAMIVEHDRKTKDEAAQIVSEFVDKWAANQIKGWLCLSANILDLALQSESAAYTTCHGLQGCHRAGPAQHLVDDNTLVCYFYTEVRPMVGGKNDGTVWALPDTLQPRLPHKLWRQLVHVDPVNQAALFMREYGQKLLPDCHKSIRREVMRLVSRLAGKETASPKWKLATAEELGSALKRNGAGLAYSDGITAVAKMADADPAVQLARAVPCPACTRAITNPKALVCESCATDRNPCSFCRLTRTGLVNVDGGQKACPACIEKHFAACGRCNALTQKTRMFVISETDSADAWCRDCTAALTEICNSCTNRFVKSRHFCRRGSDGRIRCKACHEAREKERASAPRINEWIAGGGVSANATITTPPVIKTRAI